MIFAQCSECQRGEKFKQALTEASVVRYTTKIANCVSSCSSPVAPLALCVVPSDQRDGNQCCPGFDGSVVCGVLCKYSQLHMSAKHDHEHERTEHTMSRLQPTQTRSGALPQSHPGLCGTLVGPDKDTHGTPVPLRRTAVGGPTQAPRDDHRQHDKDKVLGQMCFQETVVDIHLESYMLCPPPSCSLVSLGEETEMKMKRNRDEDEQSERSRKRDIEMRREGEKKREREKIKS